MTTTPHPDRTPIAHSVVYAVRGMPDVPNLYGPGTLVPTEISLTYRAAEDSQSGRVHAYVKGRWRPEDGGQAADGLPGQHYYGDTAKWPAWLADEARMHDPAVRSAVPAPATDRAAPICKFDEGCHRVVACEPGCAVTAAQMYAMLAAVPARAGLREQVAAVIHEDLTRNKVRRDLGLLGIVPRLTDAVLGVLPASVDRPTVYAEVADRLAADAEQGAKEGFTRLYRRSAAKQVREWGEELRRLAVEAGLSCVCGAPAIRDGGRWTHQPGTGATCMYRPDARPRCPDCQMPHVITPGMQSACASILASIRGRDVAERQSEQHAPGSAVVCADCGAKGYSICMAVEPGAHAAGRPPVVAYQSRDGRQLRCVDHAPPENLIGLDWFPRTGLEVDGGASTCTEPGCGRDVLAEATPYCSAGLLPKGSAPFQRCIVEAPHDVHVTAQGERWTDEAST